MAKRTAGKSRTKENRRKSRTNGNAPLRRHAAANDADALPENDEEGSYFFPELEWSSVKRLELSLVVRGKGGKDEFTEYTTPIERWDDVRAIAEKVGGSGDGRWRVAARLHNGQIYTHTFKVAGEPLKQGAGGDNAMMLFQESTMGVLAMRGIPPWVNVVFTLYQQMVATERTRADSQVQTIERLFTAVCTSGRNNNDELMRTLLLDLTREHQTQRTRIAQLLDQVAEMKGEKRKTTAMEAVVDLGKEAIKSGGPLVDAVGRMLGIGGEGQLPAGTEAPAAQQPPAPAT